MAASLVVTVSFAIVMFMLATVIATAPSKADVQ
jgi:hypothetical protein